MDLPNDWIALLALVFVFGGKHGLDADHLATIDGLTRYNLRRAPARARWCGLLFSLGHGAVVIIVALGVGIASTQWLVPEWMENVGTVIQAYLKRSESDVEKLLSEGIRIRLCKGAYKEPASIAFES